MKTKAKKLSPEQVTEMVELYLNSEMSAREVGAKFDVTPSNVVYHANKARKENKDLNEKDT